MPTVFIERRSEWTADMLNHMDLVCSACQALLWPAERLRAYSASDGTFEACCKHGDAIVERMRALPEPLKTLMTGQDSQASLFRQEICHWNSLFAFTSIRYNADNRTGVMGEC